jgi:hypothetical protein
MMVMWVALLRRDSGWDRQRYAQRDYHEAERVSALHIAPPRSPESLIFAAIMRQAKLTHSLPRR